MLLRHDRLLDEDGAARIMVILGRSGLLRSLQDHDVRQVLLKDQCRLAKFNTSLRPCQIGVIVLTKPDVSSIGSFSTCHVCQISD